MKTVCETLVALKEAGRKAFVPYVTAGDPDMPSTLEFVKVLGSEGAAIIELGVPFSDPMADGPVNQRAADRSLKNGTTTHDVLEAVRTLRDEGVGTPVVLFSYLNPLLRFGLERFAVEASRSGVSGVLLVDLPPEAGSRIAGLFRENRLETVFLASPTTSTERLKRINDLSSGFVYYVSRKGVTGTRESLADGLAEDLERVRNHVSKPLLVGFGISTPEQARVVAAHSDGVVVGSALVDIIEKSPRPHDEIRDAARRFLAVL